MVISTYQVNNVLRVYGDQLRLNKIPNRPKNIENRAPDKVSISAGARRQSIIDRIALSIVDRIIQYGPHEEVEKEVFRKLEDEFGAPLTITKKGSSELLFKLIDENGEAINSLSIEDSQFLNSKFGEKLISPSCPSTPPPN